MKRSKARAAASKAGPRLAEVAGSLAYRVTALPWAGALSGELVQECGPGYWVGQAREPVRERAV